MIDGKKMLGVIPARGGSKGLPQKNIRPLYGKPLLAWTIETAKNSRYLDRVVLSSEDPNIIEIARRFNCEVPFKRPTELAEDVTPGIDPILHALDQLPGFDGIVMLQPTSPLRTAQDIDGTIEKWLNAGGISCVSVVEAQKSPYWMYHLGPSDQMTPLIANSYVQRQEMPKTYSLNGAVYVAACNDLRREKTFITANTVAYQMPPERSVDIDTEIDFQLAELLMSRKFSNNPRKGC